MTTYTFNNIAGSPFTVDVPSAATYVQPNKGTTGTTTAGVDGADLFTVHDYDGEGTSTLLANGSRLYSRYRLTHFASSYVSGGFTGVLGYSVASFGGVFGSTEDSQLLSVPGLSGEKTVEGALYTNGQFYFSIEPDEEDISPDAWAGHNFIIAGGGGAVTINGSNFSVVVPNHSAESWRADLTTDQRSMITSVMAIGNTFTLRIKRKT